MDVMDLMDLMDVIDARNARDRRGSPGGWGFVVRAGVALGVMLTGVGAAAEGLELSAGVHVLAPDTGGQTFGIYLNNTGLTDVAIGGLDLVLQIGDGGPAAGGAELGPMIPVPSVSLARPVDLVTGTPFAVNSLGNFRDPGSTPQVQFWSTAYNGSAPLPTLRPGLNLVGTVTVSTAGLTAGSWSFVLGGDGSVLGDSTVNDLAGNPIPLVVHPGELSIAVVPEVDARLGLAVGLGLVVLVRRCRRSA